MPGVRSKAIWSSEQALEWPSKQLATACTWTQSVRGTGSQHQEGDASNRCTTCFSKSWRQFIATLYTQDSPRLWTSVRPGRAASGSQHEDVIRLPNRCANLQATCPATEAVGITRVARSGQSYSPSPRHGPLQHLCCRVLPDSGKLSTRAAVLRIRIQSKACVGVCQGCVIHPYYEPLPKVLAWMTSKPMDVVLQKIPDFSSSDDQQNSRRGSWPECLCKSVC